MTLSIKRDFLLVTSCEWIHLSIFTSEIPMHKVRFARDWTSKNTLKQEIQVSFWIAFLQSTDGTINPGPWYVQYFYALFVDEELHFKGQHFNFHNIRMSCYYFNLWCCIWSTVNKNYLYCRKMCLNWSHFQWLSGLWAKNTKLVTFCSRQ